MLKTKERDFAFGLLCILSGEPDMKVENHCKLPFWEECESFGICVWD